MDKISVRGLKITAVHGVKDFEKFTPQPFLFDVDIFYDFFKAYRSDDIADTVNYSQVCKIITAAATKNCFNLIEKLAYECAFSVMEQTPAQKLVLTVHKPKAPVKAEFSDISVTVEVSRTKALLSLGSSMGDRQAYLDKALAKLDTFRGITVKKTSRTIETEPYGGVAKNKFLNMAAEVETLLSPRGLLNAIHETEAFCSRERSVHWADRTLDIDIIFFGKEVVREDDLVIPHPEYSKRKFVLGPLSEIAPGFRCPLSGLTIREIFGNL